MANQTLLITGSSGLLGTELRRYFKEAICPTHKELDITSEDSVKTAFKKYVPGVVVHLAGYTDVGQAEVEKRECFRANVYGTGLLARRSPMFVYISTEYIFDGEKGNYHEGAVPNPVNFYSLTKLLGEYEAQAAKRYSIIRTLFKPRPYKHLVVPTDMWTSGDYVDVIGKLIAVAIRNVDKLPKIINIGTERKNLFELASQTRDVTPTKRICLPIRLPRDTSLDTTLWKMLGYEK